jgi:hypothetical protein
MSTETSNDVIGNRTRDLCDILIKHYAMKMYGGVEVWCIVPDVRISVQLMDLFKRSLDRPQKWFEQYGDENISSP